MQLFDFVSCTKPVTSRPVTGEMYIVCTGLRSDLTSCDRERIVNRLWLVVESSLPTLCQFFISLDKDTIEAARKYVADVNRSVVKYQLCASYRIHHLFLSKNTQLEPKDRADDDSTSSEIMDIISVHSRLSTYVDECCSLDGAQCYLSSGNAAPPLKRARTLPSVELKICRELAGFTVSKVDCTDFFSNWQLYDL